MKEQGRILRFRPWLYALGILLSSQYGMAAETWIGGLTPNVTDTNLNIDGSGGNVVLQGLGGACPNETFISALNTNVTVSIVNANAIVTGNAVGGQTILRLVTNPGRLIIFDLTGPYSLTFEGSTDVDFSRLLILCEGAGDVVFLIRGGQTLTLTNNPGINGPVEMYLILSTNFVPRILLLREDLNLGDAANNAYITIGGQSLLSYASDDGLQNLSGGNIIFNPTNPGIGRMILQVNDTGAFTMAVHQAVFTPDLDYCSVNRNIPSGGLPLTRIDYSGDGSTEDGALMMLNYNATYAEYLIDPYGDLGSAADPVDYRGSFNGLRYGISAGANHTLEITNNAYLDYVGLANNTCPTPGSLPGIVDPSAPLDCPCDGGIDQFLKPRNYSAFTIDGWYNPNAVPSQINLGDQSGIYFRSGVDVNGVVENPTFPDNVFTISPAAMTPGAGEYVFDVEAPVLIVGSNVLPDLESRIEILSFEVIPHGGPLFPVEGEGNLPLFLARNFAEDGNGDFYQYNKAAWLINDQLTLEFVALAHTDELHQVCTNNDVTSEPTYVGGEKWWLSFLRGPLYPYNYCIDISCPPVMRPSIQFIDAILQVQASIAFTGVDLFVPTFSNGDGGANNNFTEFRFYSNGYLVDNGTGRAFILGTLIGSQACDGCTIISDDAHINIYQNSNGSVGVAQAIGLTASQNNSFVDNLITTDISTPAPGQTSVEAIYLGHNSNISIGTNASTTGFAVSTTDLLAIAGDFFAFGTRGGSLGIPSTSSVTGQGGIFVDLNGIFEIEPNYIASMDVMVTKSQNGIIDLPPSQVYFADQVGITDWQKDLTVNQVIVSTGDFYSDYTLNWLTTTKSPNFFPYLISDINVCSCPPVTLANITEIPTVQGEVDQLQIVNSRIGDPAHILIDGGWVRELLWISDCVAGEAPTAVVVLQGNGRLGLNNAHRNPDSLLTQTVLGANGINIVANGNCRIDLNDDVIVDNICAILQGPNFQTGNVIEFLADTPYTFRVTKDGILDLSNFTVPGTIIRFGGNIRVNFEPGARLILGAADLEFTDFAMVEVETAYELQLVIAAADNIFGSIDNTVNPLNSVAYTNPNNEYSPLTGYGVITGATPTELQITDPYRVRIMGEGVIRFTDNSQFLAPTNGIVSIESLSELLPGQDEPCVIALTDVTLEIMEAAQFNIGSGNNILGGVFQVGDVVAITGNEVNFTLTLNGADAAFNLGSGGFFGLGAGVVRPNQGTSDNFGTPPSSQSLVLADTLFDVGEITLNIFGGELDINRIFNSDDPSSHSMVIGAAATVTVNFDVEGDIDQVNIADSLISGGGNLFLLTVANQGNAGAMRLINRFQDNIINAPFGATTVEITRMRSSILASTDLLNTMASISGVPLAVFSDIKTGDSTLSNGAAVGRADASPLDPQRFRQERTFGVLGYVDRGLIGRQNFQDVVDTFGGTEGERRARAYDIGAVFVQIDTSVAAPGPVEIVYQILSA